MAMGKDGKDKAQSRVRRSIEERKRKRRVRQVTAELLDGAARYADLRASTSPGAEDGGHEFADDQDEVGEEGFVDPLIVEDPVFEAAWAAARATLERDGDGIAGAFLGELLCIAGHGALFVAGGRILAEGGEGEGHVHDAEVLVVPVSGPADAARETLATLLAEGIGTSLRDTGLVTSGTHVRLLPGVVPFEALCGMTCTATRRLLLDMVSTPLALASPVPGDADLLSAIGGHDVSAIAAGEGEGSHFTGFLVGVAVTSPLGVDDEDMAYHPEAGEEWTDAMRERFSAFGVDVCAPTNLGDAPVEAAQARLSGYLTRANLGHGLRMDDVPDRTLVCRSPGGLSVCLWHEGPRVLVGPVTVPLAAYERHRESFETELAGFAGGEAVSMTDRGMYDALVAKLEGARDLARRAAPARMAEPAQEAGQPPATAPRPGPGNVVRLFGPDPCLPADGEAP